MKTKRADGAQFRADDFYAASTNTLSQYFPWATVKNMNQTPKKRIVIVMVLLAVGFLGFRIFTTKTW